MFYLQVDGARGEKGQKGEPAVIEPVSISVLTTDPSGRYKLHVCTV